MTLRAYKYRIYPNRQQRAYLNQVFGSVRFVWNKLVEDFNDYTPGANKPRVTEKTLKDQPEFAWLNQSISYALQQKRMDFEQTKTQFFNKNRKVRIGRMKFKKRGRGNESFRIPGSVLPKCNLEMCATGKIQLPKMSQMKVIIDRPFDGEIRQYTVSRNPSGQYFVSVLVDCNIELKPRTNRSVGIDLGLEHLLILSDGTKIENPRWFRKSQSKLKRAQQHLSRKRRGSNRYANQKLKVAKLHSKLANQRRYTHHVVSSWLVDCYDHVFTEDLNVAGMKKSLGKSVSDAGWASFVSMLEYKSRWYGRGFHKIDRFFPSSKTCSGCGHVNQLLLRSDREWTCTECGARHDRDINAAQNILNKGLTDLYSLSSAELTEYKRGEVIRPMALVPKAASVKRLVVNPVLY